MLNDFTVLVNIHKIDLYQTDDILNQTIWSSGVIQLTMQQTTTTKSIWTAICITLTMIPHLDEVLLK